MTALLIGYARCSTDQQDLTAQRDGLVALGVAGNRIYVDHELTGTNRERPGLREALARIHPARTRNSGWLRFWRGAHSPLCAPKRRPCVS
jgi:DNA invertase Pin-like site-specific DNA recombinase